MIDKKKEAFYIIDGAIDDFKESIPHIKDTINFCEENHWDPEVKKKEIKFQIKVVNEIIQSIENLKSKYEDKFECIERDYK